MRPKHDAFFDVLAAPVLYEDNSPYRLMMNKLNYIGYFAFEGRTLGKYLDDRQVVEIKKHVLDEFHAYATELQNCADAIEHRIVDDVYRVANAYKDEEVARRDLKFTLAKLYRFIRTQLFFIPVPKFTLRDINVLRERAAQVTVMEQLTARNDRDVLIFYHAMMEHTVWTCRQLTRRRAGRFLMEMIEVVAREFSLPLPWVSTKDAAGGESQTMSLPPELSPLVEKMAESVHDTWMKTRFEQGWTYGAERDDLRKTHPCLVPYDELPEAEKEYDRKTSVDVINYIISHGYKIVKV